MDTTTAGTADISGAREPAGRGWEAARVALAAGYLLGAVAHAALGATASDVYEAFTDRALVDAYADLWESVVVPNLALLQPLVVVFEFALGVALLRRGRTVRAGHAAGAAFQIALLPSGPWGVVNALLAAVHLAALRRSYPESVRTLVRRRRSRRTA